LIKRNDFCGRPANHTGRNHIVQEWVRTRTASCHSCASGIEDLPRENRLAGAGVDIRVPPFVLQRRPHKSTEIAIQERPRGNRGGLSKSTQGEIVLRESFKCAEDESLVPDNRSTRTCAVIPEAGLGFWLAQPVVTPGVGVEEFVMAKAKDGPVEVFRAGLQVEHHHATVGDPIPGGDTAGLSAYLLD